MTTDLQHLFPSDIKKRSLKKTGPWDTTRKELISDDTFWLKEWKHKHMSSPYKISENLNKIPVSLMNTQSAQYTGIEEK